MQTVVTPLQGGGSTTCRAVSLLPIHVAIKPQVLRFWPDDYLSRSQFSPAWSFMRCKCCPPSRTGGVDWRLGWSRWGSGAVLGYMHYVVRCRLGVCTMTFRCRLGYNYETRSGGFVVLRCWVGVDIQMNGLRSKVGDNALRYYPTEICRSGPLSRRNASTNTGAEITPLLSSRFPRRWGLGLLRRCLGPIGCPWRRRPRDGGGGVDAGCCE